MCVYDHACGTQSVMFETSKERSTDSHPVANLLANEQAPCDPQVEHSDINHPQDATCKKSSTESMPDKGFLHSPTKWNPTPDELNSMEEIDALPIVEKPEQRVGSDTHLYQRRLGEESSRVCKDTNVVQGCRNTRHSAIWPLRLCKAYNLGRPKMRLFYFSPNQGSMDFAKKTNRWKTFKLVPAPHFHYLP